MKESTGIATRLNEFDSLFAQIRAQNMNIDDEIKAIHLLCSLPSSWDTLCIAIGNFARPNGKLVCTMTSLELFFVKEIHRKSMGSSHHGEAHHVQRDGKQRGCSRRI